MFGRHFLDFSPQKKFLPFIKLLVQAADQDCRHLAGKRRVAADASHIWAAADVGFGQTRLYLLAPGAAQDLLDAEPLCLHVLILVLLLRHIWELPGLGFGETFPKREGNGTRLSAELGSGVWGSRIAAAQPR